jgi:hypothetical protein
MGSLSDLGACGKWEGPTVPSYYCPPEIRQVSSGTEVWPTMRNFLRLSSLLYKELFKGFKAPEEAMKNLFLFCLLLNKCFKSWQEEMSIFLWAFLRFSKVESLLALYINLLHKAYSLVGKTNAKWRDFHPT